MEVRQVEVLDQEARRYAMILDFELDAGVDFARRILGSLERLFEGRRTGVVTLDVEDSALIVHSLETVDVGFAFAAAAIKASVTGNDRTSCLVRVASGRIAINLQRCGDRWCVEQSPLS
jgi:hypothetical protein